MNASIFLAIRWHRATFPRKRHARVDADGRAPVLQIHPASVQDRDGAIPLLQASRRSFPFIERVFADTAYAADRVVNATRIVVEIVHKLPDQIGFTVVPASLGGRAVVLSVIAVMTREVDRLTERVLDEVRIEPTCRRLMTVQGVGPFTARRRRPKG